MYLSHLLDMHHTFTIITPSQDGHRESSHLFEVIFSWKKGSTKKLHVYNSEGEKKETEV